MGGPVSGILCKCQEFRRYPGLIGRADLKNRIPRGLDGRILAHGERDGRAGRPDSRARTAKLLPRVNSSCLNFPNSPESLMN